MDGKEVTVDAVKDDFVQQRHLGGSAYGLARTVTCSLVSAEARPCIDAIPIPGCTNEKGVFRQALQELVRAYGSLKLFRLITYDAGAFFSANAQSGRE